MNCFEYKGMSRKEIESITGSSFKTKPFLHQLATMAFAKNERIKRVMFLLGIGTGKTLTALYLNQLRKVTGRSLIICPTSVIQTWKDEIEKHTDKSYIVLSGTKNERYNKLNMDYDYYIINYEGLQVLWSMPNIDKRSKANKAPNIEAIKEAGFETLIADECHRFKNPSALQTKIAAEISKRVRYSTLMTGTPLAQNTLDLWGQYYVLDSGDTLGTSYWKYLNTYFFKPWMMWEPKHVCAICGEWYGTKKVHFKKHKIDPATYRKKYGTGETVEQFIFDRVSPVTMKYDREECIDLPDKVYEVKYCLPTKEQLELIEQLKKGFVVSGATRIELQTQTTKLLQITSGFLLKNGNVIKEFPTPKLDELEEVVQQVQGKCLIYHQFIHESVMISKLLKELGYKHCFLNGEVKDKGSVIHEFQNNKDMCFLIAHPRSGGEGLNLQVANTTIFYNSGMIGSILRKQTEGRTHRAGQNSSCLFIDIVMKLTIDEVLYNSLMNNTDYVNAILDYLEKD